MFGLGQDNKKDIRRCWNYSFEWTPEHKTKEELWPLKFSYDKQGEKALNKLNELYPPSRPDVSRSKSEKVQGSHGEAAGAAEAKQVFQRDLYAQLEAHHTEHEDLETLWKQLWTVPEWVDWEQIARGQDVFYRYGGANLTGLTFQSLLGGMGAAKVVETLARTGGFSPRVARRRLYETTQHILQCTKNIEAIQPGGEGFQSTIRVRFLHSAVRQRIMKLVETRPDYYNVQEWGIPVNDLDAIGTIGTFSATLIWLSLPRQGVFLREQEKEDYLALWRYVAYLIGCPDEWFSTQTRAKAVMDCLLYYEIDPSEISKTLANNVIVCLENQPPTYNSAAMLTASARWLNGDDLCDALGLPEPGLYYRALMAGQCLAFCFFAYAYRPFPNLDRKKTEFLRRALWHIIVDAKQGLGGNQTFFEFKYIPSITMTETEKGRSEGYSKVHSDMERRSVKALVILGGVCVVAVFSAFKVANVVFFKR